MSVDGGTKTEITICHACQRPVGESEVGFDGEIYHRECLKTIGEL